MINIKNSVSTFINSTKNLFIRFFYSRSSSVYNEVNDTTEFKNTIDPLEQLTIRIDDLSNDLSNLNTNVANLQQERQNNNITSDNVQNLYNDSLTNKIDTLTNNLYLFNLVNDLTRKVNDLTNELQYLNTALVNLQQEQHIVTEKINPIEKNIQNNSADIKELQQFSLKLNAQVVNSLHPSSDAQITGCSSAFLGFNGFSNSRFSNKSGPDKKGGLHGHFTSTNNSKSNFYTTTSSFGVLKANAVCGTSTPSDSKRDTSKKTFVSTGGVPHYRNPEGKCGCWYY